MTHAIVHAKCSLPVGIPVLAYIDCDKCLDVIIITCTAEKSGESGDVIPGRFITDKSVSIVGLINL